MAVTNSEALALIAESALSAANPEATREQCDLEILAIRMYATAPVQKAKHEAAAFWLERPVPLSAEALRSFDDGIADFAFHCVLEAANSDANFPKVLRVECEPHRWFGMDVPGSRRGGNNVDNSYRIIPVDGQGQFELIGRLGPVPPADVTFTLIGNSTMSKTLGSLEFRNVEVGPEGVFVITIDPRPAKGRRNHIQSTPEARYVFVRDSLTDWAAQRVNAMTVRRTDTPAAAPLGFEELVSRAAQFIADDAPYYRDVLGFPSLSGTNAFSQPFNPARFGGLISQRGSHGVFNLADDEALVVTVTMAGAEYFSLHTHDPWWRTIPFERHTSTLNKGQSVANPDGSYTYVMAVRDPGVHNWIDTAGLHEGIHYLRWQGLPGGTPFDGGPEVLFQRLIKVDELRSVLPGGTRFVSESERAQQVAARAAQVARRWLDH